MKCIRLLLSLPLLWVLAGCSSQDFGRPIARIGDVVDSGKAYVDDSGDEAALLRATQLATVLSEWERQKDAGDVDYTLGADDVLAIGILSLEAPDKTTTLTRTISKDGTITLPLLGAFPCAGLTARELQVRIIQAYDGQYLKNPQVEVVVADYRSAPVVVTGAVGKPGVYYLRRNRSSVLEVLSMADGLSTAAGNDLIIVRKREGAPSEATHEMGDGDGEQDASPPVALAVDPANEPVVDMPEEGAAEDMVDVVNSAAAELCADNEPAPWTGSHIADLVALMMAEEADVEAPDEEALDEGVLAEEISVAETPTEEASAAEAPTEEASTVGSEDEPEAELAAAAPAEEAADAEVSLSEAEEDISDAVDLNADLLTVDLRRLLGEGDVRLNLVVQGGDIVTVPPGQKEYVYVLGYVQRPGAFELSGRKRVRALQAVAMAGGLSGAARAQNSFLIIDKPSGRKVVPIDLTKIARGSRPPVYMESGNTLVIGSGMFARMAEFIKPSVSAGANLTPGI